MSLPADSLHAINAVLDAAVEFSKRKHAKLGYCVAAAFDLLVSAEYYQSMTHRGWTYCSEGPTMLVYPFTNTCPRCVSNGHFQFVKGNKPESGRIGMVTVEILCHILQYMFNREGKEAKVVKASEPIDMIIFDYRASHILIAEVKAAPLLTLPLSVTCEKQTEMLEGSAIASGHSATDNPFFKSSELNLLIPKTKDSEETPVPISVDWGASSPFYSAIGNLVSENRSFFETYYVYWHRAFEAYCGRNRNDPPFWLTNGCGQPVPRPDAWPSRKGSGYESVSDGKTSVGMDRTDDIKKGIFQVLKLGVEYKPSDPQKRIRTALMSNIHAVRHYSEYLESLRDIVWAIDESGTARLMADLDPDCAIYNLFDGILSFTRCDIRDAWLSSLFAFGGEDGV
ncbi:MAG: hypothetical protein LBS92_01685 [Candidatus Methanoplasma sp.]|nr:hypothetical protein [Candidatus Methanoplasma sp.]